LTRTDPGRAPRALIVGAGLGGLATAIHLARAGYDVTVLEQRDAPGGKVRQLAVDGFRFDMGPTILTMPFVLDELFAAAGRDRREVLELLPLHPYYRAHFPDGLTFELSSSLPDVLAQVRRISPDDEPRFVAYLARAGRIWHEVERHFLDRLFHSWRDLADPALLVAGFKMDALTSLSKRVARRIREPHLRQLLTYQAIYVGASPDEVPATYALISYLELAYGVCFPKGGMYAIALAVEQLCREVGVELRYLTGVERIVVESGRARGVVTADGTELRADVVISNADLHHTYAHLLGDTPRPHMSDARLAALEPSSSAFIVYLGVAKTFAGLPHHTIVFSDDFARDLREIFADKRPLSEPSFYVCAPSVTDPDLAPPGATALYLLAPAPYLTHDVDWGALAPSYAERLIERAERAALPGLRAAITHRSWYTPADFARDYHCHRGSIFGLSARADQTAFRRPAPRVRDVAGLYLVGGSTQPGGGVPMVVLGGKLVARLVQDDRAAGRWRA
jgi:phytoene desaturase